MVMEKWGLAPTKKSGQPRAVGVRVNSMSCRLLYLVRIGYKRRAESCM